MIMKFVPTVDGLERRLLLDGSNYTSGYSEADNARPLPPSGGSSGPVGGAGGNTSLPPQLPPLGPPSQSGPMNPIGPTISGGTSQSPPVIVVDLGIGDSGPPSGGSSQYEHEYDEPQSDDPDAPNYVPHSGN